jgi:hypothetical protein
MSRMTIVTTGGRMTPKMLILLKEAKKKIIGQSMMKMV